MARTGRHGRSSCRDRRRTDEPASEWAWVSASAWGWASASACQASGRRPRGGGRRARKASSTELPRSLRLLPCAVWQSAGSRQQRGRSLGSWLRRRLRSTDGPRYCSVLKCSEACGNSAGRAVSREHHRCVAHRVRHGRPRPLKGRAWLADAQVTLRTLRFPCNGLRSRMRVGRRESWA